MLQQVSTLNLIERVNLFLKSIAQYVEPATQKDGRIFANYKPDYKAGTVVNVDDFKVFLGNIQSNIGKHNLRGYVDNGFTVINGKNCYFDAVIINMTRIYSDVLTSAFKVSQQELAEALKFLIENGATDEDLLRLGVNAKIKQQLLGKKDIAPEQKPNCNTASLEAPKAQETATAPTASTRETPKPEPTNNLAEMHRQRLIAAFMRPTPEQIAESMQYLIDNHSTPADIATLINRDKTTVYRAMNYKAPCKDAKTQEAEATAKTTGSNSTTALCG